MKDKLKISPAETTEPELPEVMPDDGQTEDLPEPPTTTETGEPLAAGLPEYSAKTPTATNEPGLYSPEEFRDCFASFLDFLKNPETANDAFAEVVGRGRQLTADKIYNMASRYKWLNWLIDRRTQVVSDAVTIAAFLVFESDLIFQNWTGQSWLQKTKIYLKTKVNQKRQEAKTAKRGFIRKLFGSASSAQAEPVKATEPGN